MGSMMGVEQQRYTCSRRCADGDGRYVLYLVDRGEFKAALNRLHAFRYIVD